jgi:hypothetical protein
MKQSTFQYISKLVAQGVVEFVERGEHTTLLVTNTHYLVRYFPSNGDHDFIVESIVILGDRIVSTTAAPDNVVNGLVNIIPVEAGYSSANSISIDEINSNTFYIYKVIKI